MDITRDQVEKMRGEWKSYLNGDYNDEIYYCSVCGCDRLSCLHRFCPECGSPMTDKAVDILWKRLEVVGKEQEPVIDEKIKTAIRAGVFAIINSKYKNQIFWDDVHGYHDGPYCMDFSEAVTILLEFISNPSLSEGQ